MARSGVRMTQTDELPQVIYQVLLLLDLVLLLDCQCFLLSKASLLFLDLRLLLFDRVDQDEVVPSKVLPAPPATSTRLPAISYSVAEFTALPLNVPPAVPLPLTLKLVPACAVVVF